MGCFFSKKSKRKSSEKEDRTPTTTTVETTTTSNAVPLGNNTEEAPKQYSWDKREKVTMGQTVTGSLKQPCCGWWNRSFRKTMLLRDVT